MDADEVVPGEIAGRLHAGPVYDAWVASLNQTCRTSCVQRE